MTQKYHVKVNDSFDYDVTQSEIESLDVKTLSSNSYHVLHDHTSLKVEVTKQDFFNRNYQVKINGNTYDIAIANELDLLIEEMGLSLGSLQMVNDIKAPMPGLILEVNVKEGDKFKEGDYLLVLEAMKMENTLTAPRDGVVKSVSITKGETVEKNQLLIEME
ncbi:acetyl-CoA carboxylase biotin carboxyl carrier protein subunit [Mesonia sp. MT50]|uniref:Acetyl-CoA carboxylase biotin carboxyl carrier protein subunit n=1 Tax=Mesonia profundi TaxID=3070998 RepID=A0ABU1A3L1_9FLAO|nr:acetyl-CoA carboxylase biotin carboxyl carrier protein subunit [Mesonia profundi]MDQ7917439.1 acetyl-CoA carboxylase biotin carboxyl carrier protein subunit [Mesonia profundi]